MERMIPFFTFVTSQAYLNHSVFCTGWEFNEHLSNGPE